MSLQIFRGMERMDLRRALQKGHSSWAGICNNNDHWRTSKEWLWLWRTANLSSTDGTEFISRHVSQQIEARPACSMPIVLHSGQILLHPGPQLLHGGRAAGVAPHHPQGDSQLCKLLQDLHGQHGLPGEYQ